jgi:hypothetical protein
VSLEEAMDLSQDTALDKNLSLTVKEERMYPNIVLKHRVTLISIISHIVSF